MNTKRIITKHFFILNIFSKSGDEKIYCIKCNKYRNFKNPKISYTFDKTLFVSIICDKCGSNHEKYLEKKDQLRS